MMKFVITFFLLLCFNISVIQAGDSTLLRQRIQRLYELSTWLKLNAQPKTPTITGYFQYDSVANKNWKIFDSAIAKFYNIQFVESIEYDTTSKDMILSSGQKTRTIKTMVSAFSYISQNIKPETLRFRPFQIDEGEYSEKDRNEVDNIVEQYFIIDQVNIPYLIFQFKENSTLINGIITVGSDGETAGKLMKYLDGIKEN